MSHLPPAGPHGRALRVSELGSRISANSWRQPCPRPPVLWRGSPSSSRRWRGLLWVTKLFPPLRYGGK
ncbi:hypothetical protein ONE63_004696 [Megalurothrips usitatus]|uniref:Uncharacterized protein n=1 Tax=Megalurothrips usitatus TaxID=439358 RepID=A0AAV7X5Y7_9NEOP|nr:hypothetical protein ONE63_004696 [Megalurothrips usitatus]